MTISLPPGMVQQMERVRKREHRTRSELVREALRAYLEDRFPVMVPTKAELAAIERGRAAIRRGDYMSLDELLHEQEGRNRQASTKRPRKTSRRRSKGD
ncbi:MAG: CopG family ribbon-helix-helix protein [Terriglobia bacterium]